MKLSPHYAGAVFKITQRSVALWVTSSSSSSFFFERGSGEVDESSLGGSGFFCFLLKRGLHCHSASLQIMFIHAWPWCTRTRSIFLEAAAHCHA